MACGKQVPYKIRSWDSRRNEIDSSRIGVRLLSMVARNTAASVRETNIHNIHSSQPDLYTGVCICVLTSEDCEDWKSVKDRKKKERDILLFLSLIFRSNVHKIV